jgi:hypothetical protein
VTSLAQAYIHLKPYSAKPSEIRALGSYAKRTAAKSAREIYGGGVTILVEIEEGSLRTRVTVIAITLNVLQGAHFAYSTIADLKGFQEGVSELCDQAREFGVDVCEPFVRKAGVPKEDVYRFERRLKTPGKLYRFSKHLEKLQRSVDELSPKTLKEELARLRAELDVIESDLSVQDRRALEGVIRSRRLPTPRNWPRPESAKLAVRPKEQDLALFGDTPSDETLERRRLVFRDSETIPLDGSQRRQLRLRPPMLIESEETDD